MYRRFQPSLGCVLVTAVVVSILLTERASPANSQAAAAPQQSQAQSLVAPGDLVIKRLDKASDEDLRKQLKSSARDVGFNQVSAMELYTGLRAALGSGSPKLGRASPPSGNFSPSQPDIGTQRFALLHTALGQPEMTVMPWRPLLDCQLGKEPAENLQVISNQLRTMLTAATPENDVRPDPDKLRKFFLDSSNVGPFKAEHWRKPEALPALVQLLQIENTPVRLILVERLDLIPGKEASIALAQRAVFDLSAEVREQAVKALAKRPIEEYRTTLLSGFLWPWPAAADHAAEAVVALNLTSTVPELVRLLKLPDPSLPYKIPVNGKAIYVAREVVCVNHMANCLLCHAPSFSKDDLVRGVIPDPSDTPPPGYYQARKGLFVRATFTILKQDFSVVQPVESPKKWPAHQRYDYMIRERPLSAVEQVALAKRPPVNPFLPVEYRQRDDVLYGLRELTQTNAGTTFEAWSARLNTIIEKKKR